MDFCSIGNMADSYSQTVVTVGKVLLEIKLHYA